MNIFYLSRCPKTAAKMQCDKHVVKMPLETAQLLSTAHNEFGGDAPYKTTHKNHPSAIWARSGLHQYKWLYEHFQALSDEYTRRYGRVHLSWERCSEALSEPPAGIPVIYWNDPPQCMPWFCKDDNTVVAYRNYYEYKKQDWLSRGMDMVWTGV